jgi:ABC-type transport system involved in multi-copper enzyme maturation permease subunit
MFIEIFRFELRHHLRSALFWLSAFLLFLMAFGAVASDVVQIGGAIGRVNRNAPFVIGQILLVMSVIAVFVTTAFLAGAVVRDYDYRTHELFFSTRVRKRDYIWGRFLGSFVAAVLVVTPVALGIILGSAMPWLEPERVGPFSLQPYLFSFLVIVIPNLFLMSAVFFGLATATRSVMWTYVGLVVFFVGFSIAGVLLGDLENEGLAAILDPFGAGAIGLATRYWTVAERNTQILAVEGPLLTNRLLWSALAAGVLILTYALFSFTAKESRKARRARRKAEGELPTAEVAPGASLGIRTGTIRAYSGRALSTQFLLQAGREVGTVIRSLPFAVILALGVLNLVGTASVTDQLFGTPVHPRTYLMFQTIASGFLLFAIIILTFYSGEMVFRERSQRMDEVFDALPVPNGVYWGSKLVALFVIVLAVLAVAVLASMGVQTYRGYTDFQLVLYFKGVFLLTGIPFLLIAVLALVVQVVTNNKYVGFMLMALYFVAAPVLQALHFEHNLFYYAGAPLVPYSDMNGFGHFVEPVAWFYLFWSLVAVLLLAGVHLLWVRGKETSLAKRWALARQRFSGPVWTTLVTAGVGAAVVGSWIFYNTNVLNQYVPGNVVEDRQARYEKDYKRHEGIAQPRIVAIRTEVDIFPQERAADLRGRYRLRNKTDEAITELHVTVPPEVDIEEIVVPGSTLATEDDEVRYYIYRLASPLAPGAELDLDFSLRARSPGFRNHGFNNRLVENGTFINSGGFFPHIGYSRGGELTDPNERRKRDLPPVQRLPALEDEAAWRNHQLGMEADWVEYETVVSTSADQIALAPGYLQREWEEDGRRYFHYRMDAPILAYHSYLSARWAVKEDRWREVDIAVYYHPGHDYNVDKMIEAAKKGLEYFTANFGPYQHRQFRIIEFPRYAQFAEAFPNTIPFSESIGFIARLDDPDEIDYVTYVTAHELAHQWWAHQVIGAAVQGTTVMTETMAQYSALMVMEDEYGPELMRRFLRYELDSYLRGRGGELIEELPLKRVEFQPYIHYRKGSLAMYALKDYVGEDTLNSALARYVADVKFREPPYTTTLEFLDYVDDAVPEGQEHLLEDLFETITLYENQAREATVEERPDGTHVVRLTVESRKYRADGFGEETEIPVDDWIDVAVFGERGDEDPPEGKILLLEKRRVTEAEGVIELVVDEEPRQAGIDPFNKLVDRNPENNLVRVTEGM